ncbi:MAG: DUF362 domain-containing protein [Lachnospiraceae bacterium]|nr:DUF362 domain-containing protein [Lachnospiraceae bacterium]
MSKIYEIYGTDAHQMTKALMAGAEVEKSIPQGASVALKPNLVVAGQPESGATTHAGVLSGCIEYLRENGFSDISIIEGSWVGERTERAVKNCGYDRVCEKYKVPFYDLKKDGVRQVKTPFRTMEIACRALDAAYLIDLPVLKGHCQTVMTCALKNLKGCLPDHEKRRFHSDGLIKPIAALAAVLKPALVIVDSICGDLNFEEGGNPVHTNRMMLGTDPVQMDAYGCQLMGLDLEDVPYVSLAEKWGAGYAKVEPDNIIKLNEPQESRDYPSPSGKVKSLVRSVSADSACSACYASLVRALYIAQKEGISIKDRIYIGQGYRGKKPDGIGIGSCCSGAVKSVPGCPPTAEEILRQFKR